jgi:hypothetical protein
MHDGCREETIMTNVTSFEVLAQPIVPGVPDIPYVQQGTFLQLSNIGSQSANVELNYNATPAFVASSGAVILTANYIDGVGDVHAITDSFFLEAPVGFGSVTIPSGMTFLFGVQYILNPGGTPTMAGSTPQDGAGTRGLINLTAQTGTQLVALATIRQVFTNFNASGAVLDVTEAAYSVPIIGGPLISF